MAPQISSVAIEFRVYATHFFLIHGCLDSEQLEEERYAPDFVAEQDGLRPELGQARQVAAEVALPLHPLEAGDGVGEILLRVAALWVEN